MSFTYRPQGGKGSIHLSIPVKLISLSKAKQLNLSAFLSAKLEEQFAGKGVKELKKEAEDQAEAKRWEFSERVAFWRDEIRKQKQKYHGRDPNNYRAKALKEMHDKFGIDFYEAQAILSGRRSP